MPPRPSPTQRRPETEQLRETICAIATRLFAQHGFRGTSVQQIADAAGISKQLLLYHYASKEEIMRAVMSAVAETWNGMLPLLLDALTADGERFETALTDLGTTLEQKQDVARVVLLELVNEPAVAQGLDAQVRPWMKVAADYIRRRQAEGLFASDVDPEAWVVQGSTLILSAIALLHLGSGDWPEQTSHDAWRQRRLREMLRMLKSSLRSPGNLKIL
jgi:TetR/AcrR family transcriptional regulator